MSRIRSKSCKLFVVVTLAIASGGCGNLGGLGGLLGGGGAGGGFGGGLGGGLGGPLGLIFNLISGISQSFTQILTDLIAPETQGDTFPTSPFKLVVPGSLNPPLNGVLLQNITDGPAAAALGPDNLIYYTEKATGRLRRFNPASPGEPEILMDLAVNNAIDRGLLGIAFSPPGVEPARLFLTYVRSTTDADTSAENEALESRVSSFPLSNISPDAETILFRFSPRDPTLIPSAGNGIGHCGVGPDGKLYFSHGDWLTRIGSQDPNPNNPAGKIHRCNLDGSIPEDNPKAGEGSTHYAYGFRFPLTFTWDAADGKMWAADHGNLVSDELNIITAGGNYGYPLVQGSSNTNLENLFSLAGVLYKGPTIDFGGASPQPKPTSVMIVRNANYPDTLQGNILYTQVPSGGIPIIGGTGPGRLIRVGYAANSLIVPIGDAWVPPAEVGAIKALVTGADGLIYALCESAIFRLDPPSP